MDVLAIIPARSGSKSIVDKNIRLFQGIPLIAHSIIIAKKSKYITRVIVSTDSEKYAEIAKKYGAETPFLRPEEISGDTATDLEVFKHSLKWLKDHENYTPEICVHLRPTHPLREVNDLDKMIEEIINDDTVDSIRSICPTNDTPYKMWFKDEKGNLKPVVTTDIKDAYNMPRQLLPQAYMQNASIDVVRSRTILDKNSMTGEIIKGYVINYNADIDTEEDYIHAEQLSILKDIKKRNLKFCFDVDGIIAMKTPNNDYTQAQPIARNISLINKLYSMGHTIIIFTARGSETKMDWIDLTKKQLSDWGVNYSELLFGKPNADFYIDDKFIEIPSIQQLIE